MSEPFDVPEDNQSKLQAYYKAMQQEWESVNDDKPAELTDVQVRDRTKQLLVGAVPKAVARLTYLVEHAHSENIQLKAATFIIDKALGKDPAGLVGDPMEALMREIADAGSK